VIVSIDEPWWPSTTSTVTRKSQGALRRAKKKPDYDEYDSRRQRVLQARLLARVLLGKAQRYEPALRK